MTAGAWWMMALICGFVWGGFGILLVRALRQEGHKVRQGGPPGDPAGTGRPAAGPAVARRGGGSGGGGPGGEHRGGGAGGGGSRGGGPP